MIKPLKEINTSENPKLQKLSNNLVKLINSLNEKGVSGEVVENINAEIEAINEISDEKALMKAIRKGYTSIIRTVNKELGFVTKGHYRTLWMSLGMTAFGVPIGLAISYSISDGPAFLGTGFAFGIPLGLALGVFLDKKAAKEGRQLSV